MQKHLVPLLLSFLLSACAGPMTQSPQGSAAEIGEETARQKETAYKSILHDQDHLFNISFPLMAANTAFCGTKTTPGIGVTFWSVYTVSPAYKKAAEALYNLYGALAVQFVADRSPADRAGIRSGDLVLAIGGHGIPMKPNARKLAQETLENAGDNLVDITLERRGRRFTVTLQPLRLCDYPVVVDYENNDLNASATGESIIVDKGMMRFIQNDDELALIIAHELGHNAMGHIRKKKQNTLAGQIGGLAIDTLLAAAHVPTGGEFSRTGASLGNGAYSVAFEQEADYVGMYFMERAGYNSSHVADFWRRYAAENPGNISKRDSHPTSPERFIAIGRTHAEIARKKAHHLPLEPELAQENTK
jgi:hypothetical protein